VQPFRPNVETTPYKHTFLHVPCKPLVESRKRPALHIRSHTFCATAPLNRESAPWAPRPLGDNLAAAPMSTAALLEDTLDAASIEMASLCHHASFSPFGAFVLKWRFLIRADTCRTRSYTCRAPASSFGICPLYLPLFTPPSLGAHARALQSCKGKAPHSLSRMHLAIN
jgi:hypothetical protein